MPQWAVCFYDKSLLVAEVRIDAYSGEIAPVDRTTAEQLVYAYSERVGVPTAVSLHNLFSRAVYHFSTKAWSFTYFADPFDAGFTYFVTDDKVTVGPNG